MDQKLKWKYPSIFIEITIGVDGRWLGGLK